MGGRDCPPKPPGARTRPGEPGARPGKRIRSRRWTTSGGRESPPNPPGARTRPGAPGARLGHSIGSGALTGRFSRRERLTRGEDFQALFQQGKRIDRPLLVVLWREGAAGRKAGFAVSRQVRGSVKRNRARRRLREAYRASREAAPARVELVMVGRAGALTADFTALVSDVRAALRAIPGERRAV